MDNVKNDAYYLGKIKEDLQFVILHTAGKTLQEIQNDDLLVDSIMFRIIQIAENNNHLTDGFKVAHPAVPWMAIKGMRNKIVHDYGVMDFSIIYDTVINGMPIMLEALKSI